ncbi:MAG: hypothetical protein SNJ85_11195 [Cyanobacteriota bacterium]
MRPISAKQVLLRAGVGILLLGLGSQFWGRSPWLSLMCWGVGVGIGIPWDLGHTLCLDRETQTVSLTQHRGPWGLWRQRVFSYPWAQLQTVRMHRLGREVLDNQAQESFQVQSQVRLRFQGEDFEREEVIAHFSSQSGLKGAEPEAFLLSERLVRWIQPYLSSSSP